MLYKAPNRRSECHQLVSSLARSLDCSQQCAHLVQSLSQDQARVHFPDFESTHIWCELPFCQAPLASPARHSMHPASVLDQSARSVRLHSNRRSKAVCNAAPPRVVWIQTSNQVRCYYDQGCGMYRLADLSRLPLPHPGCGADTDQDALSASSDIYQQVKPFARHQVLPPPPGVAGSNGLRQPILTPTPAHCPSQLHMHHTARTPHDVLTLSQRHCSLALLTCAGCADRSSREWV